MLGHYIDMNLTNLAYRCVKRGEAAALDFHREYKCIETSSAAVMQPEDPLTADL